MSPSSSAASPGHILFTCSAPRMDTSSGGLKDLGSGGLKDLGSGGLKDLGPGGLKDLVLRWFTETQAPNILQNGNLPDWFQGLAARKDAEDLLRDKAVGCFLIRLSDKAVGYILSYRGHDRCRHFVITQNQDGQFVVAGDSETFFSLEQLIQHYRVSPIQPFGEYLTCSCHHVDSGELYDVVNAKGRSGVSVQALRTMWSHKNDPHGDSGQNQKVQQQQNQKLQQQIEAPSAPTLPPKSKNRKLTGTVSADATSLSQVPPVPKRGLPLGFSLSGSLPDTTSHPTEPDYSQPERLRGNRKLTSDSSTSTNADFPGDLDLAGLTSSEPTQVEIRSRSLPRLDHMQEEEEDEEYSNRLGSFSPKRVTCLTFSLHSAPKPRPEQSSADLEMCNPLYQASEGPGGGPGEGMYADVPQRTTRPPDDTYEMIPGEAAVVHGNTYESLEDLKTKKSKSTWGKNNMNWKKFLPDYKKK
ncbi:hematopoietic SH2 domain-containing protein homolog [Amphiprion ocellaris]|uniref:hematopoietic SH2 domain-containing protein homolog n=1 Tax=Amphiprion ocellaris TaxID=80972 RepID=UPI000C3026B8|nr:hematopoietic SH2 domain-containing protein homolog [Amphiprion ocellaris]